MSVIAVLLAACAALYGFVIKPYSGKIITAVDELLEDEEFILELAEEGALTTEDFEDDTDEALSEDGGSAASGNKGNASSERADGGSSQGTQPQYEHKPKKDKSEYNSSYDYVKDNIDPDDLKKGMSLASKADVSYILGLLNGGLTSAEKKELKAYLKSRYTSSEISSGISLYNKYSYLLK